MAHSANFGSGRTYSDLNRFLIQKDTDECAFLRLETEDFDKVVNHAKENSGAFDMVNFEPSNKGLVYGVNHGQDKINIFHSPFCFQHSSTNNCLFLSSVSSMIVRGWSKGCTVGRHMILSFDSQTVYITPKIMFCNKDSGDTAWPSVLCYILDKAGIMGPGTSGLNLEVLLPNIHCMNMKMSDLQQGIPGNEWEDLGACVMNCDPDREGFKKGLESLHTYSHWMTVEGHIQGDSCLMLFEPSGRTRVGQVRGVTYWREEEIAAHTPDLMMLLRKKDMREELRIGVDAKAAIAARGKTTVTCKQGSYVLGSGQMIIVPNILSIKGQFWASISTGSSHEEFIKKKGFLESMMDWSKRTVVNRPTTFVYRKTSRVQDLCMMSAELLLPVQMCPFSEEIEQEPQTYGSFPKTASLSSIPSVASSMTFRMDEFKSNHIFLKCKICHSPQICTNKVFHYGQKLWSSGDRTCCGNCKARLGFSSEGNTYWNITAVSVQGRIVNVNTVRKFNMGKPVCKVPSTVSKWSRHLLTPEEFALMERKPTKSKVFGSFGLGGAPFQSNCTRPRN